MMEEPITTLRIFDFDETIAHTASETRVKAPNGTEATLRNQQEFEAYMSQAAAKEAIEAFDPVSALQEIGYDIDLSDFAIVKDPEEIKVVTDRLREFPENSKTYIMTARRGKSLGPILDYLKQIGIDTNQVRPIATRGVSKGDTIVHMIGQKIMPDGKSNINRIEYYEDSQKNIDDVLRKVGESPELDEIKPLDFGLVINKVINNNGQYNIQQIECNS
jgi:muramoyltetrapeptide carboxypeptidase LdcA involved in peptidoglycan recycling